MSSHINKNKNINDINIPKRAKATIKQKKRVKEEQEEQEEQNNPIINPSIFGYNTTPITYNPVIEQEQVAIEQEPVENYTTNEIVSTPNEEEMRAKRDEYYSQDQKIKDENYYDETTPLTTPIVKDELSSLVFF